MDLVVFVFGVLLFVFYFNFLDVDFVYDDRYV